MARTCPGPCTGCGRQPKPPRRAWPAHPAYGDPICPACLAYERGWPATEGTLQELVDAPPQGPEPLSDYELAELAKGHTQSTWPREDQG